MHLSSHWPRSVIFWVAVVPNRFHFLLIPLAFDCWIFSSKEISQLDLLHRWHPIMVPRWNSLSFWKKSQKKSPNKSKIISEVQEPIRQKVSVAGFYSGLLLSGSSWVRVWLIAKEGNESRYDWDQSSTGVSRWVWTSGGVRVCKGRRRKKTRTKKTTKTWIMTAGNTCNMWINPKILIRSLDPISAFTVWELILILNNWYLYSVIKGKCAFYPKQQGNYAGQELFPLTACCSINAWKR